ncbi:hypothetical protein VNO77_22853 [Canavalia gladiata]|uniref:Uncharacterized protein n=1 Tax=Canavalia gladiata TaxID=3824 RepID=A0AAN9L4U1_CANGL
MGGVRLKGACDCDVKLVQLLSGQPLALPTEVWGSSVSDSVSASALRLIFVWKEDEEVKMVRGSWLVKLKQRKLVVESCVSLCRGPQRRKNGCSVVKVLY